MWFISPDCDVGVRLYKACLVGECVFNERARKSAPCSFKNWTIGEYVFGRKGRKPSTRSTLRDSLRSVVRAFAGRSFHGHGLSQCLRRPGGIDRADPFQSRPPRSRRPPQPRAPSRAFLTRAGGGCSASWSTPITLVSAYKMARAAPAPCRRQRAREAGVARDPRTRLGRCEAATGGTERGRRSRGSTATQAPQAGGRGAQRAARPESGEGFLLSFKGTHSPVNHPYNRRTELSLSTL